MNIAIMGYGTIGSGVVKVIETNAEEIKTRAGEEIKVTKILDLRDFEGNPIQSRIVHDVEDIVGDDSIEIVVEAMGGVEPAYTFVKKMLLAGKSVTTSNKALVAEKGGELIRIAKEKNINFEFGASVGGGIPIIRPLLRCLTGDVIEQITAICNGTTNFILTKMLEEDCDFDSALKEAQELGYAEKDPTADVDGFDSCRKIAILTSLICEQYVDFNDIPTQGIREVSTKDFAYAKKMNANLKLVATSRRTPQGIEARVAPFMIYNTHPLSPVRDVYNAVFVHGNMLGDAMFYGSGAGSLPTASAVVGDIVEMAINKNNHLRLVWNEEKLTLADSSKQEYAFFARVAANDKDVISTFNNCKVIDAGIIGEVGVITPVMSEVDFAAKCKGLNVLTVYRIL